MFRSSCNKPAAAIHMDVVCYGGIRVDNDVLCFLNRRWNSLPDGLRASPSAYASFLKPYGNLRPAARATAQPAVQQSACVPGEVSPPIPIGERRRQFPTLWKMQGMIMQWQHVASADSM